MEMAKVGNGGLTEATSSGLSETFKPWVGTVKTGQTTLQTILSPYYSK